MKLISWNITKECDLFCRHCYRDAGEKAKEELSTQEAKFLLDEIKIAGFALVIFSGGEPLLRKDIYELIGHANRLRLISSLGTNGLLLSLEVAKKLKNLKLSSAGISIDSVEPPYHDRLRKYRGAWRKAVDAAANCKKADLSFQLHTTLTKENYQDIPGFVKFSARLGAAAHYFFFLVPCGRASQIEFSALSSYEHETALRLIIEGRRTSDVYLRPVCAPQFVRLSQLEEKGCLAGTEYCLITPQGDVHPCPYLQLSIGNVRKQKFSEIWRGSLVFNNLRDLSRYKGKCKSCEYLTTCRGCRARAYQQNNDYLEEDTVCGYQPLSAKS